MIFNIRNRIIEPSDDKIISYNKDYIAEFIFDDEWTGKVKAARFIQNGEHILEIAVCELLEAISE